MDGRRPPGFLFRSPAEFFFWALRVGPNFVSHRHQMFLCFIDIADAAFFLLVFVSAERGAASLSAVLRV